MECVGVALGIHIQISQVWGPAAPPEPTWDWHLPVCSSTDRRMGLAPGLSFAQCFPFLAELEMGSVWEELWLAQGIFDSE